MAEASGRIAALDLIRGVAVLGILAINIAGFAGPQIAALTPNWQGPTTPLDEAAFALGFVVFEGKMRALFTMLFGASMVLFLERAEAAGPNAGALQLRRLGWLALFGYLHFALIWWGDILFAYALCGCFGLVCWRAPAKPLLALALTIFILWHGVQAVPSLPDVAAEEQVRTGTATRAQTDRHAETMTRWNERNAAEAAIEQGPWPALVAHKLTAERFRPLAQAIIGLCETVPLMLIGMALFRSGFFAGEWPRRRLWQMAGAGVIGGGALTLVALAVVWPRHFPPVLMNAMLSSWLALPHLLMALGYAALLMLAAPRVAATGLGIRLRAAGRAAFTNYVLTSLVMTALFYGWGLGLYGEVGAAGQWLFVLLGWALMLAWGKPWLARFRYGPLEWLWRSLSRMQLQPLRK